MSEITIGDDDEIWARASHQGYARFRVGHQRRVQLSQHSLLLTDEVSGEGVQHRSALHFILGPDWQVSVERTEGKCVSCHITGPRKVTLACESQSELSLSIQPTSISREYGSSLAASCILIQSAAPLPASIQTKVEWN